MVKIVVVWACALTLTLSLGCSDSPEATSSGGMSTADGGAVGEDQDALAPDGVASALDSEVGAPQQRAPIFIATMTHLEGNWSYDGPDGEMKFTKDVEKIDLAMDVFDAHGALLTIESEIPFATAASAWDSDIFDRLMARGHGVGTHCDIGPDQPLVPIGEFAQQFIDRKAPMDALIGADNNLGCSGGQGRNDWILGADIAGFKYIAGIVGFAYLSMPLENRPEGWTDGHILIDGHFHDNVPVDLATRIHPFMMSDATDMVPDEDGRVLLLAGGLGRLDSFADKAAGVDCNPDCAFEDDDITEGLARIEEALSLHDPTRVGKIEVYFPLSNFHADKLPYIESFLSQVKAKYIDTGALQWGSQSDIYKAYVAWNGLD